MDENGGANTSISIQTIRIKENLPYRNLDHRILYSRTVLVSVSPRTSGRKRSGLNFENNLTVTLKLFRIYYTGASGQQERSPPWALLSRDYVLPLK